MSRPSERELAFAAYLAEMARERRLGALAALRRGLGKPPGQAPEMFPFVVPWLPAHAGWWEEQAYYLTASAFAAHQLSWPAGDGRGPTNFGASMARLVAKVESGGVEHRFVALLSCHRDDLPQHLAHLVSLLQSKEVPVDWAQLLHDVRQWGREDRAVQRAWAGAYWTRPEPAANPPSGVEEEVTESRAEEAAV